MRSPIKQLMFNTVLYLPLCFFIWFYLSTPLVYPVHLLSEWFLATWQSDLFRGINQNQYWLSIETLVFLKQSMADASSQLAVIEILVNPLMYGYGLAVFSGLTIAVPNTGLKQKLLHIIIAYVVVVFLEVFGVVWRVFKHLMFSAGPEAQQAILETGLNPNIVAVFYQLSYLILPALIPVALWVGLNKVFINELIGSGQAKPKL